MRRKPSHTRYEWTEERNRTLHQLWIKGYVASEIAGRLATTKGSIWAQARRLNLPYRDVPKKLWTDKEDDILMNFWVKIGLSASQIGAKLCRTKNSIIGRIHRLGLTSRSNNVRRKPPRSSNRRAKAGRLPIPPRVSLPPTPKFNDVLAPKMLGVLDLKRDTCKWPIGDKDFRFCGHRTEYRKPYCPLHCRVAYVRPTRKKSHFVTRRASNGSFA